MGDMAEYDDDDTEEQEFRREPLDKNIREQMRRDEKTAKEATARATAAEERLKQIEGDLAHTKAGIPETGWGEYFRKGYSGDLNPEAIKQAAQAAGLLEAPQAQIPDRELEQMRDIQSTSASSLATTTVGYEGWLSKIANASSIEEVMALVNTAPPEAGVQHFAE